MWSYDSHSKNEKGEKSLKILCNTIFKKLHWPVSDVCTIWNKWNGEFLRSNGEFSRPNGNFWRTTFFSFCLQTNPKLNPLSFCLANLSTSTAPTPLFGMVGTVFIETFWLNETRATPKTPRIFLPEPWIYLAPMLCTTLMSCVAVDHGESAMQVLGKKQKADTVARPLANRAWRTIEQHVFPKFKYTFNSTTTFFFTCVWWYRSPSE